jgi:hypothetical protein
MEMAALGLDIAGYGVIVGGSGGGSARDEDSEC